MKTVAEVAEWREGAEAQFGDPAIAVGQTFFRYVADVDAYRGGDLVFGVKPGDGLELRIWPDSSGACGVLLNVSMNGPDLCGDELVGFGVERIQPGLWVLSPSLNMPGTIHAFVTLYGVPDPAPWEKRIILVA